jgi:hypothetical protein
MAPSLQTISGIIVGIHYKTISDLTRCLYTVPGLKASYRTRIKLLHEVKQQLKITIRIKNHALQVLLNETKEEH